MSDSFSHQELEKGEQLLGQALEHRESRNAARLKP